VLFANSLRKIGIEARVEAAPWPVVNSRFRDKNQMHDMVPLWKSTYYADPNNWVGELLSTRYLGVRNNFWYSNPELDKLTDAALNSTDQAERTKLYEQASRHVVENAVGIYVYNTNGTAPIRARSTASASRRSARARRCAGRISSRPSLPPVARSAIGGA